MKSRHYALCLAIAIGILFQGCKKKPPSDGRRWSGIPTARACDWDGNRAFCVAEGKSYNCIADEVNDGCDTKAGGVVCVERRVPAFDLNTSFDLK